MWLDKTNIDFKLTHHIMVHTPYKIIHFMAFTDEFYGTCHTKQFNSEHIILLFNHVLFSTSTQEALKEDGKSAPGATTPHVCARPRYIG